jgi:hypothetical protein
MTLLLTILIVLLLAAMLFGAEGAPASPETQASKEVIRVGTFDSRGVALAYYMSDEERRKLDRERREAFEKAKAEGDKERLKQLEEQARGAHDKAHRQVAGCAGIDEILERLRDRLPRVAREACVDLIVERARYVGAGVQAVDVTELMARQFGATEETLRELREVMKQPPVEFDQLAAERAVCYRPEPDAQAEKLLLSRLGKATVTVFPAVVRRPDGTSHDAAARDALRESFGTEGVGKATASQTKVDLGKLEGESQWEVFQGSLARFVEHLRTHPVDTEFAVLVEFLVTRGGPGGEAVRGIHCFILDGQGRSAAAFLMNSDHAPFQDARLRIAEITPESRKKLLAACTRALLEAFRKLSADHRARRAGRGQGDHE